MSTSIRIVSLNPADAAPLVIAERIKSQLPYLTSEPPQGVHENHEYWIDLEAAKRTLDDGSFLVVSPLRAENAAEIELSEEAEEFLEWIVKHAVTHFAIR
jgi:hypothetical protein